MDQNKKLHLLRSLNFLNAVDYIENPNNKDTSVHKYSMERILETGNLAKGNFFPDFHTLRRAWTTVSNPELLNTTNDLSLSQVLFEKPFYEKIGCQVETIPHNSGSRSIGQIDTEITPGWWVEGDAVDTSEPTSISLDYSIKNLANKVVVSRTLLYQSPIDFSTFLLRLIYAGMNKQISKAIFYGSGSAGQPTGMKYNADVQTVSGASFNWDTALEIIEYGEKYGDLDNRIFIMNAATKRLLSKREKIAGEPKFIIENGKIENYPVLTFPEIANGDIFFGDYATTLITMFGEDMDVLVDINTLREKGKFNVLTFKSVNFNFRNPASLVYCDSIS